MWIVPSNNIQLALELLCIHVNFPEYRLLCRKLIGHLSSSNQFERSFPLLVKKPRTEMTVSLNDYHSSLDAFDCFFLAA